MKQNYRMVDISDKQKTKRIARARGTILLSEKTMDCILKGVSPKGDILKISEISGIIAAKNTSSTLPLCHPLNLESTRIWFEIHETSVDAFCEVTCEGKTGVEMEALVGVNVALLTMYDLAKAIDPVIEITSVYLETKVGGKSGEWFHPKTNPPVKIHEEVSSLKGIQFSVTTLSDRASAGDYADLSGKILKESIAREGGSLVHYHVIQDSENELNENILMNLASKVDVLLLTGGTGISKRDITPDLLNKIADKELVGLGELQRHYGSKRTPLAWLSRSSAFMVQGMLVVLFPGSPNAVRDGFECVAPLIPHAVQMMKGGFH